MAEPLSGLRFSIAGPGRVGSSLAAWAVSAGAEQVSQAGRAGLGALETAGQDLLLIATSDSALEEVAALLARRPQARIALHTSGSLDAGVLEPLLQAGTATGSLHPLKAFPRPLLDPAEAQGVFFALDGQPEAVALGARLAQAWGGVSAEVPPHARPLYHFAATLAAGGVTTLLCAAAELASRLGLPDDVARGYVELARGAVAGAATGLSEGRPLAAAITGPAARGDRRTLDRHLEALAGVAAEKLPLAMFLALETLRQTGRLSEEENGGSD